MAQKDEKKPVAATPPLFNRVMAPLQHYATKMASGEVHVSGVKEYMQAAWRDSSEEEKKEAGQAIVDGLTRLSSSIESLKQEFTIATVNHRQ